MSGLVDAIRTRVIPATLTAIGVALLGVGLLSYGDPVSADQGVVGATPSPTPTAVAAAPTPSPLITLPPLQTGEVPTPLPTVPADRVATRIRIAALGIDLPIVKPPSGYPYCDVAMYITQLGQPGEGRATYIFAHARTDMFLPILQASLVQNGKKMLGMVVEVWTSDNQRFLYEITEVRRHQLSLDDAFAVTSEQLWMQTSEGPKGTPGKTQVIAMPISQQAADPADAHPTPHPLVCG